MTVDILVPNFDGREALELCIESIAAHTSEAHRVIVYDDASPNEKDREYLAWARGRGWVEHIIVGREHTGHGTALNALIDASTAPYAVIIDNDIQILRKGWLSGLLGLVSDPKVLIGCTEKPNPGYCSRGYRPGMFLLWFGILNMKAYRDGMAVDWSLSEARRADEPWQSFFVSLYPPQDNAVFRHLMATQWEYRVDFDAEKVIFDPGSVLWCKMRYQNPKKYLHRELTPNVLASFGHWGHGQMWLEPEQAETKRGKELRTTIRAELAKLRGYSQCPF